MVIRNPWNYALRARECRGCNGLGLVAVPGPLAFASGVRTYAAVREWCVCGECAGSGEVCQ